MKEKLVDGGASVAAATVVVSGVEDKKLKVEEGAAADGSADVLGAEERNENPPLALFGASEVDIPLQRHESTMETGTMN